MGFWSDLKELGKNIGGEFSNLGSELKDIGKDTVEEIKQDPTKYIVESAAEIAAGTVALAVGATKMVMDRAPEMALQNLKEMDKLYSQGKLSEEQGQKYFESRSKVFENEKRSIEFLVEKDTSSYQDKDISELIDKLRASESRVKWLLSSSNFDSKTDAGDLLKSCEKIISELKEKLKELKEKAH